MGKKTRNPMDAWKREEEEAREEMFLQRAKRDESNKAPSRTGTPASVSSRGGVAAGAQEKRGVSKKKRRKASTSSGFEVVPLDAAEGACTNSASSAYGGYADETRAKTNAKAAKNKGVNSLRDAHKGASSSKGSSAERKANEIWFRKCGHGERLFAEYYRGQPGVVPPDRWRDFEDALATPLLVTFRLHGLTEGGGGAQGEEQACALKLLRSELEKDLAALRHCVKRVPWAPKSAGIYQATVDKRSLARSGEGSECSELAALLADSVSCGLLNRQEAVSMLPVIALQVQPGMCCLDTCASPGSKTMQLLEAVSAGSTSNGLVIANDAHPKRAHQLIDTIARHSRSAAERARLVVTCHRGEAFPLPSRPFVNKLRCDALRSQGYDAAALLGFDRVLCDVPCSGDGTIRKDPTVRPRWTPAVGNQLHAVQLEIGWRGLQLLRVGGLMAYSTCTFNPIEDEAVVAALLRRAHSVAPGAVTLEEWPEGVLPDLIRQPGLRFWRVADHLERGAASRDEGGGGGGGIGKARGGGGGAEEEGWENDEEEVRLRWHASFEHACAARMQVPSETRNPKLKP
jgi:16S rRNA C967 or C1407 C5-methylase (RsmB/RsmF family)